VDQELERRLLAEADEELAIEAIRRVRRLLGGAPR
jgi:hypothetical protein